MTKIKKISINAFEKVMSETYIPTETFDWNGIEVVIKKSLSLEEMLEFVNDVVDSCFTSDTNTYLPEVKDFAIKACVLKKYTNFNMPQSINKQYDLIYCTDAFLSVIQHINMQQFEEMMNAIEAKLDNLAQANIEAVNRQVSELYTAFEGIQKQLSEVFSGVGADEMRKMAHVMANGGFDEGKLVKAYIEQSKAANG